MDNQSDPHDNEKKEDLIDNKLQKSESSGSEDNNGQSKEWKCKCEKSYSRQSSLHNHIRIKHDNLKDQFEIRNNVRPGRPKNAEGKEKPGGTKNEKQLAQPKCVSDYDWAIMSIFADQTVPELIMVVKNDLCEHYNQDAQVQLPQECKKIFDELVEVADINGQELSALTILSKPFGLVANMIKVERREFFFRNFVIAAIMTTCDLSNKTQKIKSLRENPLFNEKIFQDFSEILRKSKKNPSSGGLSIVEKQEASQFDKPSKELSNKQHTQSAKEKVSSAPLIRNAEPNDRSSHNHSYDHLNRFYSDFQSLPQQNSAYPQHQKKQPFHSTNDIGYQTQNSNYPLNHDNHGIPAPLLPVDQQPTQNYQYNSYQPQQQQQPPSYEHQQYYQSKQYQYQQQHQQQQQFFQPQQQHHQQQQQVYQQYYQQSMYQNPNPNSYPQTQQNNPYQQNNYLNNQPLPQQTKIQPYQVPDPYLQQNAHQLPPAYSHQQLAQVRRVAARSNFTLGKNIPNDNANDKLNHPFAEPGYGNWIPPQQQRDEYSEQYQENPIQQTVPQETPNYSMVHDPVSYYNTTAVDELNPMRYEQNEFLNQNLSRNRNLNQNNILDNSFFERSTVKQQESQEQLQNQLENHVPLINPPNEFQEFTQQLENNLISSRNEGINNNIPQIQQFQQGQSDEEEQEGQGQREEGDDDEEEEADDILDSFDGRLNNK